eukprot:4640783-Amphidinium_carterae.1
MVPKKRSASQSRFPARTTSNACEGQLECHDTPFHTWQLAGSCRSISEIAANAEWSDSDDDESEEYEDYTALNAAAGLAGITEEKSSDGIGKPAGSILSQPGSSSLCSPRNGSILSQPGSSSLGSPRNGSILSQPGTSSLGSPKNTKKARIVLEASADMEEAQSEQADHAQEESGDGERRKQRVSIS